VIRLRNITIALVALCALAVAAPAAWAKDGNYHHVISECYNTGQLNGSKYTRHALREARDNLPSDIKEYSDCFDLISAALAAPPPRPRPSGGGGGGGAGGGSGGGGSTPPGASSVTPVPAGPNQQDLRALSSVTDPNRSAGVPPQVTLANGKLSPTTGGLLSAAKRTDSNTVPLPLILSLAGLAAMAALGGAAVVRQRWPRTRAALRLRRR